MSYITTTETEPQNTVVASVRRPVPKKLNAPGASDLPVKKSASSVEMETAQTAPSDPDFYGVYEELFDPDVIEYILRDEGFSKETRTKLWTYKRSREQGNRVNVKYYYGKGCGALKVGRVYCKNSSGLQSFLCDVRDPLTAKYYWDLDMENAHYWIMRNFCEKQGLRHDKIDFYCDNREECLRRVSSNRSLAKTAFLKCAYGGNVKLADVLMEDDGEEPEGDITLIKEIRKEIETVIRYVKGAYPAITKLATDMCKRRKAYADKKGKTINWNVDYSTLALVLQTEEHGCLEAIEEYLKSNGRRLDMPIHDGGRVRKLDNEVAFPTELLRGAEEYVKQKKGFTLQLKIKPLLQYTPSDKPPAEIIDDEYASRRFVELMGEHIVREEDTVYYFNPDTGMWECGDTAYRCAVRRHKDNLIFTYLDDMGKERTMNYGGCEKNVSAMKKWITTCIPNGRFISDNLDTSIGKLLYKDGYYDFATDTFCSQFDPKIVFNRRITREAPKRENRNEALIRKVEKLLFEDAFDEGDGKMAGSYLKKCLAMGLFGDYRRKKFYACLGDANCGKGLTTTAFKKTFEGYVDEWNANELKYNPRNGQDEARKLAWVKELIGCRLAFSNEFRMDRTPIDGNQLKAVSSGGDQHKGRGHQEGAVPFINRATMFLFGNDFGNITPKDTGIQERCRFIRYRLRFVSGEPSAPDERVADPEAKDYFDKDEYRDALFWVMVDTYNAMKADEKRKGGVVEEPDCVKEETKDWVGDDGNEDFEVFIKRRYEITGDKAHRTASKDIVEYIMNECKMTSLSANKIGRMLTKMIQAKNKDCPRDDNPQSDEVGKQRLGIRLK